MGELAITGDGPPPSGAIVAVDFGTCNTVVAYLNPATGGIETVHLPGLGRRFRGPEGDEVAVVPSLVHLADATPVVGQAVHDRGLADHPATFAFLKKYVAQRKLLPRKVGATPVTYPEAAEAFLQAVLAAVQARLGPVGEAVLTTPVEAFEHYQDWLADVCGRAGIERYRLVDEATACALGYDAGLGVDDVFAVVDFGGGTLDVAVVRLAQGETGRHAVVLGKAGEDLGGVDVDAWLLQDLLARHHLSAEAVAHLTTPLLQHLEQAKIALSFEPAAEVAVFDDVAGRVLGATYTRADLEALLEARGLFARLRATVDAAVEAAEDRGVLRRQIREVLLVGGSSLIPSVQRALRQAFGDRLRAFRPFDAVARGACMLARGDALEDFVQHTYALRHFAAASARREFYPLIERGTRYPTADGFKKLYIDGAYKGQHELELLIYEVAGGGSEAAAEIVFDEGGRLRFVTGSAVERHHLLNERNPTFIKLDPPATGGTKRLHVSFKIDGHKRLCVSVYDQVAAAWLFRDQPVVRLR